MTDRNPSILLVDDDRDICENMADIFGDLGYEVHVAHEGKSALSMVRERAFDVAILDLKMPGMDGLTLYREIRKLQAGMEAFLITAYAGAGTADEAIAAGMCQILSKPVDVTSLMHLITEALERPLVLVVDSDDTLCRSLWSLLHERGYRVGIAHDSKQAVEQLRSSTRVVLIELQLPDNDVIGLSRLIREAQPNVRVMLVAGHHAESETKVEYLRADVHAICYKPFNLPALLGTLDQLTREA